MTTVKVKRKVLLNRRGISTIVVASVFFLILTFSTLFLLISGFFGYNLAVNDQMKFEQERAQEKIILTALGVDVGQTYITFVQVNNTGTIQVRIRAVYETFGNKTVGYKTTFLSDPSTYMDTSIDPNRDLIIWPSPNATWVFRADETKIVLVTERGTKTTDYEGIITYGTPTPPLHYDTSRYYLGPLELMFTAFYYRKTSQTGVLDPNDPWHPGWTINKGYGYVAWNITVRNIDNETSDITLNTFSSITLVPNSSPPSNDLTWYIEPSNGQNTQMLPLGQSTGVVFIWADSTKRGTTGQQIYTVSCRVLAFLTFYGWFHWRNGTTTTYGQTIPFEAAITII